MTHRAIKWMIPKKYRAQLSEAKRARDAAAAALLKVDESELPVALLIARLEADRLKNNYGPTIKKALGGAR